MAFRFRHPTWILLTEGALLGITVFSLIIFVFLKDTKWAALVGGLSSAAFLSLLPILFQHSDIIKNARRRDISFVEAMPNRGRELGATKKLLRSAKRRIFFMGVNGEKLLTAANDPDGMNGVQTCFKAALDRGVDIRVLIASRANNPDHQLFDLALELHKGLAAVNPQYKFHIYNQVPSHYILIVDDQIVFGPIFPHCGCPDMFALHFNNITELVGLPCVKHFVAEWQRITGSIADLPLNNDETPKEQSNPTRSV